MKPKSSIALSIATATLTLLLAQFAQAQQDNTTTAGLDEATLMVPAQAALLHKFDAGKAQPGQEFRVTLSNSVHLKNGPELPRGSSIVGTVASDKMQEGGMSRIILRFTKAELKDGKSVPIKATIVGVYAPGSVDMDFNPAAPGDQYPNAWNSHTLQVDQINAVNGVDLHSNIASSNSGALVSTKKSNMKLAAGSEFALAIAAA
jgi:hypothetical protein